jgi:hypothetical protein
MRRHNGPGHHPFDGPAADSEARQLPGQWQRLDVADRHDRHEHHGERVVSIDDVFEFRSVDDDLRHHQLHGIVEHTRDEHPEHRFDERRYGTLVGRHDRQHDLGRSRRADRVDLRLRRRRARRRRR